MRHILFITLLIFLFLTSCEKFSMEKISTDRDLYWTLLNPDHRIALLTTAYTSIPSVQDYFDNDFLDCATDNAVSNVLSSGMNNMLGGRWLSTNNPLNNWSRAYYNIFQVNQFFDLALDDGFVYMKSDETQNARLIARLRGEAYFLRAWHQFDLLRRFAGKDASGNLLGFPIITQFYYHDEVPQLARNTFAECLAQIIKDCDSATVYLPEVYTGTDVITGTAHTGRPTKNAGRSLKSRTLLYAASPAYTDGLSEAQKQQRWSDAAKAALVVINTVSKALPNVYNPGAAANPFIAYYNSAQNAEIIMRRMEISNTPEDRNFPPSHYGNGRANPSQNLVDAFPGANGYPITRSESLYDADNPYANRDPRLFMSILYNGALYKGRNVETFVGGLDMPGAPGVDASNSTRTGYYIRKWLSTAVSRVPGNTNTAHHYYNLFRHGELFLNFAEAANEAYGPDADPDGLGFTAAEALREIRRRGRITQPDAYLDEVVAFNDKDAFRTLVHNERRIELCFEDHRFFDVRRWKVSNLNVPVQGMEILKDPDTGVLTYNKFTVVTPQYQSHMFYGPIPYSEVLKTPTIVQNQGW